MAKRNYGFEKRQKEQEKKRRKEEKSKRRVDLPADATAEPGAPAEEGDEAPIPAETESET